MCYRAPVRQLDIHSIKLRSLIWATGYRYDFSWIDLPVLDARAPQYTTGESPLFLEFTSWVCRGSPR